MSPKKRKNWRFLVGKGKPWEQKGAQLAQVSHRELRWAWNPGCFWKYRFNFTHALTHRHTHTYAHTLSLCLCLRREPWTSFHTLSRKILDRKTVFPKLCSPGHPRVPQGTHRSHGVFKHLWGQPNNTWDLPDAGGAATPAGSVLNHKTCPSVSPGLSEAGSAARAAELQHGFIVKQKLRVSGLTGFLAGRSLVSCRWMHPFSK